MENPNSAKVRYSVDGSYYDIPSDKVEDFERDTPQARQVYRVGEETYAIPLDKRDGFMAQYPDATFWNEPEKQQNVSVPQQEQPAPSLSSPQPEKQGFWARLGRNLSQAESSPQGVSMPEPTAQPQTPKQSDLPENWEERSAEFDADYDNFSKVIDAKLAEKTDVYKQRSMEREKGMGRFLSGIVNAGLAEGGAITPQAREEIAAGGDPEADQLRAAAQLFESAKKTKDAAYNQKGVIGGLADSATVDTWDFGITDMKTAQQVYNLAKKIENNEELTENDNLLLEAMMQNAFANEYYSGQLKRGYKAGQVTGESLPFMLEFLMNPLAGGEKAASGGAIKVLEKNLAKRMAARAEKAAIRSAEKSAVRAALEKGGQVAMKALARGGDDVLSAAGMAATTGSIRTLEDAYSRKTGDVQFHEDPDGGLVFDGFNGAEKDWWKAAAKAYGATTIEDFSEMFGNYFRPIGQTAKKGLYFINRKIGLGKVNDLIEGIGAKEWARAAAEFLDRTDWNGPISEFGEEVVGGVMNALTVGDQTLSASDPEGVFNKDNMIDTFLGVALFGGVVSAMKTVGYSREAQRNSARRSDAIDEGERLFGEDWQRIQRQIDAADEQKVKQIVATALEPGSEYTPEQKKAIGEYAGIRMVQIGMEKGRKKRDDYVNQGVEEGMTAATPEDINRLQIDSEYAQAKADRERESGEISGETEMEIEHSDAVKVGRRNAVRGQIVEQTGQPFWKSVEAETQQDVVDVITYADGREAYIISDDGAGTYATVDATGKKGFITEAQIEELTANNEAVRGSVPLNEYLDVKIGEQNTQAEQQRMVQDAANNLAAIQQRVQEEKSINVGTPESEQMATVIDMNPAVEGGIVVQVEGEQQPRTMSWKEVATAYGMPLEPKSNREIVNERLDAEEEADNYNKGITPGAELAVPLGDEVVNYQFKNAEIVDGDVIIKAIDPVSEQEVDLTPEMVANLPELIYGNVAAMPVSDVQGNPVPAATTESAPAPIFDDPIANSLGISSDYAYTTKRGEVVVDGSKLWAENPTLWAEWNDRNPNRVIPTKEYLEGKLKEIDSDVETARQNLEAEAMGSQNPDAMEDLQDILNRKEARQREVGSLIAKYNAAQETAAREAENAQREQETAESTPAEQPAAPQTADEIVFSAQSAIETAKDGAEKAGVLQKMFDDLGTENTRVTTSEAILTDMRDRGASERSLREVAAALQEAAESNQRVEGFFDPSSGTIYMLADQIGTAEDANRVQIHEEKHMENDQTGAPSEALRTGVTREEMAGAMRRRKNTRFYDNKPSITLADELLAVSAEIAEEEGVDAIPQRLRELGITNEEFINFVQNNIDYGRRNGQRRHIERRNTLQPATSQVSGGQDGRDREPEPAGVGRPGNRLDEGGRQGAGGREAEPTAESGAAPAVEETPQLSVVGDEKPATANTTAEKRQVNEAIDKSVAFVQGTSIKEAKDRRLQAEGRRKQAAAELYSRVLNSQFDDVTLQLINEYIDNVTPKNPYGRRISERLPQEVERGLYEGARTNAVDALFSRICEGAVGPSRRALPNERRRIQQAKNAALKGWAIATGNWYSDLSQFTDDKEPFKSGTDSDVYMSKDGQSVIKVSKGKGSARKFAPDIDNIPLFNYLFPNTAYEILGYGEFNGKFSRILRQPFVDFSEDDKLNPDERVEFMAGLGFTPINKEKTVFTNRNLVVADLQKGNIVFDKAGNVNVIDADVKLHTKDVGGEYTYPPVEKDVPDGFLFSITGDGQSIADAIESDGVSVNDPVLLDEYGLSDLTLTKRDGVVTLNKIVAAERGNGAGTRFMNDLTAEADSRGWTLALTPDDSFGASSVNRLKDFYRRFGFKANKGRNTDFTINESMIRRPQVDQELNDAGLAANSEEVRFSVRYSPSAEKANDVAKDIAKALGVPLAKAKRWVKSETSLATLILDEHNSPYLDYEGDERFTAIKQDSDYPQGTVDFNNICRKRIAFTQMYQRIQKAFPNTIITGQDLATIRQIMKDHDITVACGLCYVEDRRQLLGEIAKGFIEEMRGGFANYAQGSETKQKNAQKFRDMLGDDTKEDLSIYDLITLEGSDALAKEHPGIYAAFQAFNAARGQQAGNLFQGYAEYKREILNWSKKKVDSVNANGGLRIFSYSDFEAHHLIDLVQIIQDCARKGVMIQGYTKVPAFARAVANTGIKLNRSLIPLGDTGIVDGRLAYDPVEGIDINDKDFLPDNDNIGNFLIGINDEQIRLAMADPFVHYIIPYHSNQSGILRKMKQTGAWTNYKNEQTEKGENVGKHGVNIYTDVLAAAEAEGKPIKNEKQFVERFLQVCKEKGWTPRFARFLNTNEAGEYVYTPGYYKLLLDFKLFDEKGRILPQKPVQAEFDDAFNQSILEAYVKDAQADVDALPEEIYQEIIEKLGLENRGSDIQFSITAEQDAEYMQAVESGDMEKAQEMVDETAQRAGYTINGFHGTTHNFTIFDRSKGNAGGNWGKGFYFTSSEDDASANYGTTEGPDLTNRIEILAEQMEWMDGYEDKDYDTRLEEAKKMLAGDNPHIISAAIRMENPVIINPRPYAGDKETFFDYNSGYNPETDEHEGEESGLLVDFLYAWKDEMYDWGFDGDNSPATAELIEYAFNDDGIGAYHLETKAREILDNANIMDEEGTLASGEFLRSVFERMGFDGIVDEGVNVKFGTQRKYGTAMDGMDTETIHFIAFQPNQIKQTDAVTYDDNGDVIPLSERFNPDNDDIRFSVRGILGAQNDAVATANLDTAKDMEKAGKDAKTIWLATGWEKGKDGKWRSEIPDGKAKAFPVGKRSLTVADVIDAPELFEAYPEIKDYKVSLKKLSGAGAFVPSKKEIELDADYNAPITIPADRWAEAKAYFNARFMADPTKPATLRKEMEKKFGERRLDDEGMNTVMHELQHAIQSIEGFAKGGSERGQAQDYLSKAYKMRPEAVTFARAFSSKNSPARLLRFGRTRLADYITKNAGSITEGEGEATRRLETLRDYINGLDDWGYRNLVNEGARLWSNAQQIGKSEYPRLAGETEARNVEKRRGMSEEERRNTPLSETEDVAREEQVLRFSVVTDPAKIDELENGEKELGFRTVTLNPDGSFGSPKAGKLRRKGEKSIKTSSFELNRWEQAEENPQLATEDGKINLADIDGVDYNPYIHIRPDAINKQFTSAWRHPEQVYIETAYPTSELSSGYHAEKAKLSVGRHAWTNGDLILSRWDKPERIVPWEEVADAWEQEFKDTGVTFDIVSPNLLSILAERGVEILPPKKAAGKPAMDAYERWKKEQESPRFSVTAEQDQEYMDAVQAGDMEKAQRMVDEAAKAAGYTIQAFHGGPYRFNVFDRNRLGQTTDADSAREGFFFTPDKELADDFARMSLEREDFDNIRDIIREGIQAAPMKGINDYYEAYREDDSDYENYLEDCEDNGEEPTDEGFLKKQGVMDSEMSLDEAKRDYLEDRIIRNVDEGIIDEWEEFQKELAGLGIELGHTQAVYLKLTNPLVDNNQRDYFVGGQQIDEPMTAVLRRAKQAGHDGVIFSDIREGGQSGYETQYVVFNEGQVKSADPVERDDEGNVIPLSNRFNPQDEDIRFSVAYHGSGAEFDRFDLTHAYEGEGAMAHGYGHYVALNPDTSIKYANIIGHERVEYAGPEPPSYYGAELAGTMRQNMQMGATFAEAKEDVLKALRSYQSEGTDVAKEIAYIENLKESDFNRTESHRYQYTVSIPDDTGDNYIDEMKTLPKKGRRRIADVVRRIPNERLDRSLHGPNWLPQGFQTLANVIEREQFAGLEIRDRIKEALGNTIEADKEVSRILHDAGFVGFKYNGRSDGPSAVIFSDDDIKIDDRIRFSVAGQEQEDRAKQIEEAERNGLKGVIGEEGVSEIFREAYASIPKDDLKPIVEKGLAEGGDIRKQLKVYLHGLAKRGTENDTTGLLFKLFDDIRFMASNPALTDADIRWMLFKETSDANEGDLLALAEERAMRNRWGVGLLPAQQLFQDATENAAEEATQKAEEAEQKVEEAKVATASEAVFSEAERSLLNELKTLTKAMEAQKAYDKATVNGIVKFAKEILKNGRVSAMTAREVSRLLSLVNASTGKSPKFITRYVNQLMDMLLDHIVKQEEDRFTKLVNVKAKKVNQSGVEAQGKLDIIGQAIIKAFRENMDSPVEDIKKRIENVSDRILDDDDAIRKEAQAIYSGLMLALQYKENISENIEEFKDLDKEFKDVSVKLVDLIGRKAYDEFIRSSEEALRKNRMERIDMYRDLSQQLTDIIVGGVERATAFREAEKQRVEDIHHDASRDMKGTPAREQLRDNRWQRFLNSDFVRFFTKSLATADQMFRLLGRKSATGEGYLYNRYIKNGVIPASERASRGLFEAMETLDKKAAEVFDKPGMKWSDIYSIERKMPGMTVTFLDGGEMVGHELTQGNMLYIYMANKMQDGKMKLRRMGISEEDVEAIKEKLDPRFVELADWMQDEFYVNLRNKYNAVHERMFGAPMAAIDDYVPLKILSNARYQDVDLGNQSQSELSSTITGSIIKRRKNSLALDILHTDAFSLAIEHIEKMEDWAAFAELRRDMNTLLSYKHFHNQILNMNTVYGSGETLWGNFMDVCSVLTGSYKPKVRRGDIDRIALNAAKGVTGAKIAFRVNTAIKQLLSFPAYFSDARLDYLIKSLATPRQSWNWCMENLPLFEKRWKSRIAGDTRLLDTDSDWAIWKDNVVKTASRLGMTPNAFVDATTVAIGAKAMYDTKKAQYIKDGYSEDKADEMAKRDAEILYNQTQQSSENAFVSPVQLDRTVWAVTMTTYRNSSMAYQRQLHDAIRNTARMMKPGYRARSIEFMKNQNMNNGLSEEDAQRAAERQYNRQWYRNLARVAIFGYGLQFLWKIGNDMWYLLFGDDDDEKNKILEDAALAELAGPVEGLVGGNVISEAWGKKAEKKNNDKYGIKSQTMFSSGGLAELPLESDMGRINQQMDYDEPRAINGIIDLLVQSGVGVNPQTLTDAVVALIDYANGDLTDATNIALGVMRIAQIPQSTIERFMVDQIDMDDPDKRKEQTNAMAKQYAAYKVLKNAPLTRWMYDDETIEKRLKSQEKAFKDAVKRRVALKEAISGEEVPETPEDFYKDFEKEMKSYQTDLNRAIRDKDTLTQHHLEAQPEYQQYVIWKKHQKGINKLATSIEKTIDENLKKQWEEQRRDSIQTVINELNENK